LSDRSATPAGANRFTSSRSEVEGPPASGGQNPAASDSRALHGACGSSIAKTASRSALAIARSTEQRAEAREDDCRSNEPTGLQAAPFVVAEKSVLPLRSEPVKAMPLTAAPASDRQREEVG
jgi:hypothetical protein